MFNLDHSQTCLTFWSSECKYLKRGFLRLDNCDTISEPRSVEVYCHSFVYCCFSQFSFFHFVTFIYALYLMRNICFTSFFSRYIFFFKNPYLLFTILFHIFKSLKMRLSSFYFFIFILFICLFIFLLKAVKLRIIPREYFWGEGVGVEYGTS